MKNNPFVSLIVFAAVLPASPLWAQSRVPAGAGQSQGAEHAVVVIPDSSVAHPGDVGRRAHTNHLILARPGKGASAAGKIAGAPSGETPASLACVYGLVPSLTPGCPIATSTAVPSGGRGTIVIVNAYDYPTAYNDLKAFSKQFNLPILPKCTNGVTTSCFQVVYAAGFQPPVDCGWAREAALDIEWAHAMAPEAKIVLVEAASNYLADLMTGVSVANNILNPNGIASGDALGQVSMSWSADEFPDETYYDSYFTTPGVVYFAASGDTGGHVVYPAASPNVVGAGGTSLLRSTAGDFLGETGWSGSGGGISQFEFVPSYQTAISGLTFGYRGVPDLSFNSDPFSGVSVYDTTPCPGFGSWLVLGGTSVAAPSLAGITNLAGGNYNSTDTELSTVYACYATNTCYNANFFDITTGAAGTNLAGPGWDFVTGVGSPRGKASK